MNQRSSEERFVIAMVWLSVLVLCAGMVLLAAGNPKADDFTQYWAAGRIQLAGGNPYSPEEMLREQWPAGWRGEIPLMMWNPPWTIPLVLPLARLPYNMARTLWLLISFVALILSVDVIWRVYGGSAENRWVSWLLAVFYVPTLATLAVGQIGPLLLVGIAGFCWAAKVRRWALAGVLAFLLAIKPQLVYLFWPALALWAVHRRCWRALAGCALAIIVTSAIAIALNPPIFGHYLYSALTISPLGWVPPTLGSALRRELGMEHRWLQFAPTLLGGAWFAAYWWRQRHTWDWLQQMPVILLASLITTSFGWSYDNVVLLPAAVQMATRIGRSGSKALGWLGVVIWTTFNTLAMALRISQAYEFWYLWMPVTLLAYYLLLHRVTEGKAVAVAGGAGE